MSETLVQAWTQARADRLEAAGIDGPVIDARLMLEAAADASRTDILTDPHRLLTDEQVQTLEAFLARREAREPVSHILGRKGFWSVELKVTRDVLTPRPDTETLVGAVLAAAGRRPARAHPRPGRRVGRHPTGPAGRTAPVERGGG